MQSHRLLAQRRVSERMVRMMVWQKDGVVEGGYKGRVLEGSTEHAAGD